MFDKIIEFLWRLLPDNCEVCGGAKGGVRGNENVVDGVVICDYCHVERMKGKADG
jgi:hypothetical protein